MWNWVISVISFCLLLGGNIPDRVPPCAVVTQVTVQWNMDGTVITRGYTQQDKMNKVLNCIRALEPIPQQEIPDTSGTTEYCISVVRSDGAVSIFYQLGTTNFRKQDGTWEAIDPKDGMRLLLLLAAVPSDFR